MSLYPFENPIGFGAADFLALLIAAALVIVALRWKRVAENISKLAERTLPCMMILGAAPILLRLALLPHHPAPSPDIYDEFGHLLVADTLRHFRLANPTHPFHRFFETFFTLQEPTYSSIYPIGQGLALAFGKLIFGHPWAGVILSTAAFCSLTYWMLRAWTTPMWSLAGGVLSVIQFGPLCYWMNTYWGGSLAAAAGCLVFGAWPRLKDSRNYALISGTGLALLILIRPYESLFIAVPLLLTKTIRFAAMASIPISLALGLTLLHNHSVTRSWTTLPYALSQYQYGVPASLTIQEDPAPHGELTPQQAMGYKSQLAFRTSPRETVQSFLLRLEYRVRFYRFFFLAPLYVALLFFLSALRERRFQWIAVTILLVSLGANIFPSFEFHYLAPIACLFLLIAVIGLEQLARFSPDASRVIMLLCCLHFLLWYSAHLFDSGVLRYETWAGINHKNPERRITVNRQLPPGKLLIFVHYSPGHIFQDEWVYNEADIDAARVVWARDLGAEDNAKLQGYYPDRKVYLLEPDSRPPRLTEY